MATNKYEGRKNIENQHVSYITIHHNIFKREILLPCKSAKATKADHYKNENFWKPCYRIISRQDISEFVKVSLIVLSLIISLLMSTKFHTLGQIP